MYVGIPIFQIKVSVIETEWSGIPVSISRTYSRIVPFWKLEIVPRCVPETGKIPKHVLETGKIPHHILETGKVPHLFPKTGKILEHIPETRTIPEHIPKTGKIVQETIKISEQTRSGNRKQKNFRYASRNGTRNLLTILNVVIECGYWLLLCGWNWFVCLPTFQIRFQNYSLDIKMCIILYVQYILLFTSN